MKKYCSPSWRWCPQLRARLLCAFAPREMHRPSHGMAAAAMIRLQTRDRRSQWQQVHAHERQRTDQLKRALSAPCFLPLHHQHPQPLHCSTAPSSHLRRRCLRSYPPFSLSAAHAIPDRVCHRRNSATRCSSGRRCGAVRHNESGDHAAMELISRCLTVRRQTRSPLRNQVCQRVSMRCSAVDRHQRSVGRVRQLCCTAAHLMDHANAKAKAKAKASAVAVRRERERATGARSDRPTDRGRKSDSIDRCCTV
jgi:hypothetical protein